MASNDANMAVLKGIFIVNSWFELVVSTYYSREMLNVNEEDSTGSAALITYLFGKSIHD
jgi:hypothetical protein